MQDGWVKVHRQILESEIWTAEKFSKGQAWVDLLLLANHKPQTFFIRGIEIRIERGQLAYSQLTLAKRWKWNRKTVVTFLYWLENRKMVDTKTDNKTTVITIKNYPKYQDDGQQSGHQNGQQKDTKTDTNKNVKKEKNEKKETNTLAIEFEKFWELYPTRNGKKLLKAEAKEYFQAKIKDVEVSLVLQAVRNYANSRTVTDGYAKDAIRFLRKDYWREWIEPETQRVQGRKPTEYEKTLDVLENFASRGKEAIEDDGKNLRTGDSGIKSLCSGIKSG